MSERHQRVIVAVKWGPLEGRKRTIAPGEVLRVGRGELADLVVPNDVHMSPLHFEVAWDGERCLVKDLRSARGIQFDGELGRTTGEVTNGSWIKAGETVFTIHFEHSTPMRPCDDDDDDDHDQGPEDEYEAVEMLVRVQRKDAWAADAAKALSLLRMEAEKINLYAVLDSARDRRILELLRESPEEYRSLYDGIEGERFAHVAPYLVHLPASSKLLEALAHEGWNRRWGIYLTSRLPFTQVRRHLRRFLIVEEERTGDRLYFRYYDPLAMKAFLSTGSKQQIYSMLYSIESILLETISIKLIRTSE
ncbi:DUF4123 domain-containing protein [Sorangium sp. So ce291]|uniref:DUF4123 domain-containing protein n=1 Tax=Sorangium sp. So ce291 TaxID=3133294 RepID=UPI003F625E2E